jgi:glycosyltransferase involved in cell wall biosynthesis
MDLFVSASLWEGLPTVIMESMASGIPVLATDIPGSNDLIKNQENGWLVPPGDSHQLAEGIIDAILNDQLRLTFSKKSIEFVKRYSIPAVARKHLALYTNMVNFKP